MPRPESPSLVIAGRLGASVLALVSSPIVARAIGPEGRGETAAAMALFLIVPVILGVGLPLEVRRLAATSDGRAVVRGARVIVAMSTPVALALALLAYFTIFSDFDPAARMAASVGIALAPLSASWAMDISVLVAHRRYKAVLLIQLLQPAMFVCLILSFWALNIARVSTVIAASVAASVVSFVAGLFLVRVPIRGTRVSIRKLVRKGLTYSGGAVADIASNRVDQVIALPLIGAYEAGIYSVAATIASVPLAIGHALAASYFAPIAQAQGEKRRGLQSESIRGAVAVSIMTIPLLGIAAWILIPVVFGQAFTPSIWVTIICLLGSAGMVSGYVASMALAADGRGIRMTLAQTAALAVGISALLGLGPVLGAIGAAIASTLGYIVLLILLIRFLQLPISEVTPRHRDYAGSIRRLARDR